MRVRLLKKLRRRAKDMISVNPIYSIYESVVILDIIDRYGYRRSPKTVSTEEFPGAYRATVRELVSEMVRHLRGLRLHKSLMKKV